MEIDISKENARKLVVKLQNSPIAPGRDYSHLINVGTENILNSLDENYFEFALADGIGCFKYLEGGYGKGKTQFIHSLAKLASERDIVTTLATVDKECPFNSPAAIYRAIVANFQPLLEDSDEYEDEKGITILIDSWIRRRFQKLGVKPGDKVPEDIQLAVESQFEELWKGPPDNQMATALSNLTKRLIKIASGAYHTDLDQILIEWVRGGDAKSSDLRKIGLFAPVRDDNAFKRLKTVITFLRKQMDYRGFLIAFDEGTRTNSFRRGTPNQKQAIENLLTMINQNTEGEFGGVMFLYSATPEFRNDVISKYQALQDRIGLQSFSEGSPMVPLIKLDDLVTEEVLYNIGDRLLAVYSKAFDIEWDQDLQNDNIRNLVEAQKNKFFETATPRVFVYQCCRFLNLQRKNQHSFNEAEAEAFVDENENLVESDDE